MEPMEVRWPFGRAVNPPYQPRMCMILTSTLSLYRAIIDGKRIPVSAGEEYFIPKGTWHSGEALAGTRTIHAFGARRVERVQA